jgi:hypothetical protein
MTAISWIVAAGATAVAVAIATLVIRNQRGGSQRAAGRQLANDIEAWMRAREKAIE